MVFDSLTLTGVATFGLDTLLLKSHPFWGGKTAPIRTTVIPYPVPSVLRWMLPIMYGGENHASPTCRPRR